MKAFTAFPSHNSAQRQAGYRPSGGVRSPTINTRFVPSAAYLLLVPHYLKGSIRWLQMKMYLLKLLVQECANSYAYKLQVVQFRNSIFN